MLRLLFALLLTVSFAAAVACGDDGNGTMDGGATTVPGATDAPEDVTVHLGFFPNLTHGTALVGLARGTFAEELGTNVKLEETAFNAGPEVIEALLAGDIDISYIGPNPAINGYVRSNGEALRIIAGSTSGGAFFVIRPEAGIETPADLEGTRLASPQLGNTQDVALRNYLHQNGLDAQEQGGNVQILPTSNADILTLFQTGNIDGAWVPEPWATRLVQEAGGEVFVDERDLWPDGEFVTTHVIVRTEFLQDHPDVVQRLLQAHVDTTQWINANQEAAKQLISAKIGEIAGAPLSLEVIDAAWPNLTFTYDPLAATLRESAAAAFELGFLESEPDLTGIYELDLLNAVLQGLGLQPVQE